MLSGGSAIGKGEWAREMEIELCSRDMFFCVPTLACGVDRSGIVELRGSRPSVL